MVDRRFTNSDYIGAGLFRYPKMNEIGVAVTVFSIGIGLTFLLRGNTYGAINFLTAIALATAGTANSLVTGKEILDKGKL